MSRKASPTGSGLSSAVGAANRLFSAGANRSAPEGHGIPLSNDAVATEFSNLAIVNNAERGANEPARSVASAQGNAAVVIGVSTPPPPQVTDDDDNHSTKGQQLGTKRKEGASSTIMNNPVRSVNTVTSRKPVARENPNLRVRITRFSHCEMCNERDTSSMVQCDTCDLWYHFSCVEVTGGVADRSWVCPACGIPEIEQRNTDLLKTVLVDPPLRPENSRKSTGKASSNRSNQRKVALRLQMLEEQKQLEQRFLEEKYRILDEEECDDETVVSEDDVRSMEMSKVQGWLIDTSKCGEDSGLVDGDGPELQAQRLGLSQRPAYTGIIEPRSTLQEFNPNQRSTPRHQSLGVERTRNNYVPRESVPVSQSMFHQSSAQVAETTFRHPSSNVEFLNRYRQPGTAVQFRQPLDNQSTHQHAGSVPALQYTRRGHPSAPMDQFQPATGGNRMRQLDPAHRLPRHPESNLQDVEDNVCILNRSQLAARQAVSKELPEFYGNPEDWPLFFSMYNSSTQMCGFSNEENMLRLRKCLRGKALEAVRCRLLHPSNVNSVISTLKMLYGRPEAIVQSAIRKVRSLPSPQVERLDTVVNFALTVENLVATIEACGIEDFVYNASLKFELIDRLPPGLKLDWAKHSRNISSPNLLDFSGWLYSIAEDASAVMQTSVGGSRGRGPKDGFVNIHAETELDHSGETRSESTMQGSSSAQDCFVCKGSCPSVAKCKRFGELSLDAKWAVVRDVKLCRKCLRRHNGSCRQQKPCGVKGCTFLHHPLLHNKLQDTEKELSDQAPPSTTGSCNVHQVQTSEVLFRIVPVLLHGPSKAIQTYAFIDDGSELTLLEDSLAEELGVKGPRTSLCLKWTGGTKRVEAESQIVDVGISSTGKSEQPYMMTKVHTIQNLQLRPQTLVLAELQQWFKHLKGLSVESYTNVCPRILIGLDNASLGHAMKGREGKPCEPIAVKTRLGWIVYGSCSRTQQDFSYVNVHAIEVCECNRVSDDDLHTTMKEYFALDSLGIAKPNKILRSTEDERAMEILETHSSRKEGRYESGLLWKYDDVRLPNSTGMAFRRWQCLDRRMKRDKTFSETIQSKMADYVAKGYVRKLTDAELNTRKSSEWYLPVFPVTNPNKPGKLRLVWDAAAAAYGVSLNSLLLKGPDLLTSLLTVLVQFRQFRIAVCGDIREMYLQILLKQDVRLCFFWKDSEDDENPSVYTMLVLPFGVSCAPTIAQYVKNTNAQRFSKEHPAAVHAIVDQHYVDDMLMSTETEQEAIDLARNVKKIHAEAGFEMRNWISNCPQVLKALEEPQTKEKSLNLEDGVVTEKVLGMWWNTTTDCFFFKISPRYDPELMSGQRRPTKREVLRTLMMIFDPLGLIGHFLMYLKGVLQEIWRTSVGWDEVIEEKQFGMWMEWLNVLPEVAKVEIPRCFRATTSIESSNEVQLHVFVDASEKGFAAVAYLRFQERKTIETSLVGSKTRVAPIKFLSIPRSELQASVIGVRLANSIQQSLTIKVNRRFFWTDSTDVISWLQSDHRRYSQFVAFRVSEILETSDVREWQWIQTKQNVADEGTKWKRVPDMSGSSRWLNGPDFLGKPEAEWPIKHQTSGATVEELRPHLLVHLVSSEAIIDPHRFSKWTELLRRMAYVFRFVKNTRISEQERSFGPLTSSELAEAENYFYRLAQRSVFADEVAVLLDRKMSENSKLVIPKSSSIHNLCPFLDKDDVLRVRGRTGECRFINQETVNPIILPKAHHVTCLVVSHYHRKFHHQNHNVIINELRLKFSIPQLKATYNRIRRDCQQCKNESARPQPPAMGDLPLPRLAAYARPFTYMGVDYFGPYMIILGRRLEKRPLYDHRFMYNGPQERHGQKRCSGGYL
ncbi:uncharacterized protein LOC134289465 [Aedes albopictus]|uniref:PHD-type domain-containing protein n=1 Tax=Aedes albopictus TaxID=7160 RepID=A0ABM1ZN01_AEDAL